MYTLDLGTGMIECGMARAVTRIGRTCVLRYDGTWLFI